MGDLRKELFEEFADFENSKKLSVDDKRDLREKRDALFRLAMKRAVNYAEAHYKEGDIPEERQAHIPLTLQFNYALFHAGAKITTVPGGPYSTGYDQGLDTELRILRSIWPCI